MLISTRGRYALRIMLELAQYDQSPYMPLPLIAEKQGISEKYLEIVVKELVKGGLLIAIRGKGGGYRLNRPPEEYSVKAILELMEGPLVPVACLEPGQEACPRRKDCRTFPLWQGLSKVISDYLVQFTLADLCAKK